MGKSNRINEKCFNNKLPISLKRKRRKKMEILNSIIGKVHRKENHSLMGTAEGKIQSKEFVNLLN